MAKTTTHWTISVLLGVLCWSAESSATFTVTAADDESGQVGTAGASCPPLEIEASLYQLAHMSVPGRGALNTQSWPRRFHSDPRGDVFPTECRDPVTGELVVSFDNDEQVVRAMFEQGATAQAILTYIENPPATGTVCDLLWNTGTSGFYPDGKQFGVVTATGTSTAHTGTSNTQTPQARGSVSGNIGARTYSIQGNTLTGTDILDAARDSFTEEACDLPERMMRALEAAAALGGDKRCVDFEQSPDCTAGLTCDLGYSTSSNQAYIAVDSPDGPYISTFDPEALQSQRYLFIEVTSAEAIADGRDPIEILRERFNAWRVDNPCPAPATQCADGIDNDNDGLIDAADPACPLPEFDDEAPACNDGVDNDGDGLIDLADPVCYGPVGVTEARTPPMCSTGIRAVGQALPMWLLLMFVLRRRNVTHSAARP